MKSHPVFKRHPLRFEEAQRENLYRGFAYHFRDADTVELFVDKGVFQDQYLPIRLRGIDCSETNSGDALERSHGLAAREWVIGQMAYESPVLLSTTPFDVNRDRVIGTVFGFLPGTDPHDADLGRYNLSALLDLNGWSKTSRWTWAIRTAWHPPTVWVTRPDAAPPPDWLAPADVSRPGWWPDTWAGFDP